LFKTVRFTASAQLKAAVRRQQREQEAHMNSTTLQTSPDDSWKQVAPLLDEAVAQLSEKDRQAILLRYFENKSLSQVGGALAVNEDTARKRVGRAVEKLRRFFARRGVVLSAATIGAALSANAVQTAPIGLAVSISAAAAKGSAVAASTLTLVKGALKLMTLAKLKIAAAFGTAAILAVGTTLAVERSVHSDRALAAHDPIPTQVESQTQEVLVAANTTAPANEAAAATKNTAAQPGAGSSSSEIDDSAWSRLDSRVLATLPPALIIRPTHFSTQPGGSVGSGSSTGGERLMMRAMPFNAVIGRAYGAEASRVVLPAGTPEGKFDVLMTVPNGSKALLQEEIKKQFGAVATREMREGDVLVVAVKKAGAPGLKASEQDAAGSGSGQGGGGFGGGSGGGSSGSTVRTTSVRQSTMSGSVQSNARLIPNELSAQHQSIQNFMRSIQSYFDLPLYDETGLTGNYDISLKWTPKEGETTSDAVKVAMLEQLGLELTTSRANIEMLVVRKAE
jgi:uncharacterized protein (TIGR03435 family)